MQPFGMGNISFKRHRFPPDIIRRAVWLYARFTLSYRDVEGLLSERGLDVSCSSVRCWFLVIRGQRHWLWCGVDNEGEVLDFPEVDAQADEEAKLGANPDHN